jgi:hypothetical protein
MWEFRKLNIPLKSIVIKIWKGEFQNGLDTYFFIIKSIGEYVMIARKKGILLRVLCVILLITLIVTNISVNTQVELT